MTRFPILLLLLSACSCSTFDITRPISNAPDLVSFIRGPRDCFTPCGMRATEGDCESLQRYEGRVTKRLALGVPEWSEDQICEALSGWTIQIHYHDPVLDKWCSSLGWHPDGFDDPEFCVSGLTKFDRRTITLSETNWAHSALAHEIAHVAEGVGGHCRWKEPGLLDALHALTGRVDGSGPEPECSP